MSLSYDNLMTSSIVIKCHQMSSSYDKFLYTFFIIYNKRPTGPKGSHETIAHTLAIKSIVIILHAFNHSTQCMKRFVSVPVHGRELLPKVYVSCFILIMLTS